MGIDSDYKADSAVVAAWVLGYWAKRQEYQEAKARLAEDIAVPASRPELVPIRGSMPGDRTGALAVELADATRDLERHAEWLRLVEEVDARLPPKMQLFLHLRWEVVEKDGKIKSGRYRGRPAWVPYVQHKYCAGVAKLLKKRPEDCWVESPSTFTEYWARIVTFATYLAAKRGLV